MHCTNSLTLRLQTRGPQGPANWKHVPRNHKHIWMQEITARQCPAGPHWQFNPMAQQLYLHKGREFLCYLSFQKPVINWWTSRGKEQRSNSVLQSSTGKSPYAHSLFRCTILHTNAFLVCESKTIKEETEPWSYSKTSKIHLHYQCAENSLPLN